MTATVQVRALEATAFELGTIGPSRASHPHPSAWREQLKNGVQPLSKYWKGTYSFLDNSEVQKLRRQGPGKQVYIDKNVDEGKIQVRYSRSLRSRAYIH